MRIVNFIRPFIIANILIIGISCNNEPIDPSINVKTSGVVPVTNPTNPVVNPIIPNPSGDYYPLVKNNNWNFFNGTVTKNLKITAVEVFNMLDYYKVNKNFFMTNQTTYADADYTTHFRKKDGKYYERIFVNKPEIFTPQSGTGTTSDPIVPESSINGVVIQPYEFIFLKDGLAVNDTFTQTIPLAITKSKTSTIIVNSVKSLNTSYINSTANLVIDITLVEKTLNAIVNGYTTTVIKTKTVTSGIPGYQYNWYAKDIGLIEQTNVNAVGVVTDYFKLTAFTFY